MIVFDASTIVGAALKPGSKPEAALHKAQAEDVIALSDEVEAEIEAVFNRAKFAASIPATRREAHLAAFRNACVRFEPAVRVQDCRDAKDNKYLELASASGARTIVSSDQDLLVLGPWRGVAILSPASYLAG